MRINNNLMAMNTHRQLGIASNNGSKSMEKLSSGLRINRAGDDAAGLAISEKMRGQIRGLNQASRNAQDGISLVQTAEGALNETHVILQRMRELAVQSSNDTNTQTDRSEIQKEIDQLSSEITRIADTTEFNTQSLLDGTFEGKFQIGANANQTIDLAVSKMDADALGVAGAVGAKMDVTTATISTLASDEGGTSTADTTEIFGAFGNSSGSTSHVGAPTSITAGQLSTSVSITDGTNTIDAQYALFNENNEVLAVSEDGNTYTVLETATAEASLSASTGLLESAANTLVQFDFGTDVTVTSGTVTMTFTDNGGNAADTLSLTAAEGVVAFDAADTTLASGDYTVVDNTHALISGTDLGLVDANNNLVAISTNGRDWNNMLGDDLFDIPNQTGNTLVADDTITISSSGGVDVSSQTAAEAAITTINDAIESVSAERSKLGAIQNRLEHTINNLDTSSENLQASESRIRDVDMAKEMMEFTKNNILTQAAQSMLAQANQAPQGVLQLLR